MRVIKWRVFFDFTKSLETLSTCKRRQVGCVIVESDLTRVHAIGYNGPPAHVSNDACRIVEGNCGCIHAEANALIKLNTERNNLILISTSSPCEHCAGLIINNGKISRVLYRDLYRDVIGIRLIEESIDASQWTEILT